MSNNKLFVFFSIMLLMLPVLSSCGKAVNEPSTQIEVVPQAAREERLEKFDNQLANIKDEASAKTAITTFANYVEGEPKSTASSVRVFSEPLIDRLARLEVTARRNISKGIRVSEVSSGEGVITTGKVADAINLAKDPALPEVRQADIEFIQAGVRSEIPSIVPSSEATVSALSTGESAPAPSNIITPIEAMVIGYVIASEDDGSAGPGAHCGDVPPEKVNTFLDKVTE